MLVVVATADRVQLIKLYYENRRWAQRTAELFNRQYEKYVSLRYVLEFDAKFRETGSATNRKRQIEPTVKETKAIIR